MAWRTVMIQNPARLNLSRGQLKIQNEEGDYTLPLEDLTALVLENPQITLTSSLLSACQEQGVCLITCDKAHIPNGVLLPFLHHSRQSRVAKAQLSWSEPLRKRLWQRVVQCKITNQARCIDLTIGSDQSQRLYAFVSKVASGDPDNIEAQAARDYWPKLFGADFRRSETDSINAALNYGYAVVRAFVARSQVAYGLLPAFGIHHQSDLNAFNLTDDLMEMLRPMVDLHVWQMLCEQKFQKDDLSLPLSVRQSLANMGNITCKMAGQIYTIANACDRVAASLVSAIDAKGHALLETPELISDQKSETE